LAHPVFYKFISVERGRKMAEIAVGTWVLIIILAILGGALGICLLAQVIVATGDWDL
jgi:hypothetical protein